MNDKNSSHTGQNPKRKRFQNAKYISCLIPEPTARSDVPGVSPGRGLLIPLGYLHPGKCEHTEVQSHPPLCNGRSTLDGFCRYAHARVITNFKNMADYHEERTLEGLRKVENEDKNDCHKTTRDS